MLRCTPRKSTSPVILRSEATENLLLCQRNRKSRFLAALGMTGGLRIHNSALTTQDSSELPSVHEQQHTVHVVRVTRRQKRCRPGDVIWLAQPAGRNQIL